MKREVGKYFPIYWDQDGDPCGHYVVGHVDGSTFREACKSYGITVSDDAKLEHIYIRTVRSSSSDFDHEIRHCSKGRGARPMTYWEIQPHRGVGAW